MITKSDIIKLLIALQFHKDISGEVWSRTFINNVTLEVNTAAEKFLYKDAGITVTGATTANFSQNENFVVFECVCRLLEKEYNPKNIELEPAWKLGHTDKGGRADIWVRTKNSRGEVNSLLIIECKTAGREFDGAWRKTLEDGDQLFSYFQQEGSTKFLCLYTSDLIDDNITSEYHLINVQDNYDYLKTLRKPKTFSGASTVKERFAVWRDIYKCEYAKRGLFEKDITPNQPGKNKYSTEDLREIDHASMQKKYHEFATILRKHNVSGHENAFDKLVNLFLAKVVDEKRNPHDLKFYWKGIAYDDAYSLQDRLQYLYMVGMREFLGETVTYIDEATVKKAFGRFEKDPDATKDAILRYFRQLKFFSNNDFSFIDVHNERLFNENAEILLKIVQMLEDVKLKTDEPNQFLGDLFEGFLDHGVKQSEGQFFTPLPIVRFIISALPIQAMLRNPNEPPHVIDYACGAGHFINEYAQQFKRIARDMYGADANEERANYSAITGVEKEYRLSKVAKVAAFMYGEDDIQIIYADALARNPKVPEGSFDILVANPPYSVKGFLETLPEEERNRYELIDEVSDLAKQNSIETFFVERAVQLLKPTGIAAIILPSSVLSNGGGVYRKCREIILKNFDIIAIAEFGSGTFGKTGTNTITVFLRKKDAPPDFADHWRNRANAWFAAKHDGDEVFGDAAALERYCEHRNFDFTEYKAFLSDRTSSSATEKYPGLWDSEAFRAYRAAFAKKKKQKKATPDDIALLEAEHIRKQENERLYYFLLADANPVDVLVIKMPNETKAAKAFLGYEWSAAKGNEGIKYIGVASNSQSSEDEEDDDDTLSRNKGIEGIQTPLFNNSNLFDAEKLNSLIRYNFGGTLQEIPEALQPFAQCIPLVNMLDFESSAFDKQFRTSSATSVAANKITSKYPLELLGKVAPYVTERVPFTQTDMTAYVSTDNMIQNCQGIKPYEGKPSVESVISYRKSDILVSNIRPYLKKIWLADRDGGCSPDVLVLRVSDNKKTDACFLYYMLSQNCFFDFMMAVHKGVKMPRGDKNIIPRYKIPQPPIDVQRKVVRECEKVDEEYSSAEKAIQSNKAKIADMMNDVHEHGWSVQQISDLTTELQYGTSEKSSTQGKVPVIRMGNMQDGFIVWDDLVYSDNEEDIAKYSLKKNDVLFNRTNSPEHVGKVALYRGERPAIFAGYLIRVKYIPEKIDPIYLAYILNSEKVRQYGFSIMSKSINQANISAGALAKYKIPVPPLAEQKKIVEEVSSYEAEIAKAQALMDSASARKRDILRKYGIILASPDSSSSNS